MYSWHLSICQHLLRGLNSSCFSPLLAVFQNLYRKCVLKVDRGGGYYSSCIRYYLCIQHSTRAREKGVGGGVDKWGGGDLIDTSDGRTDGRTLEC